MKMLMAVFCVVTAAVRTCRWSLTFRRTESPPSSVRELHVSARDNGPSPPASRLHSPGRDPSTGAYTWSAELTDPTHAPQTEEGQGQGTEVNDHVRNSPCTPQLCSQLSRELERMSIERVFISI
jgi:hypothetical protein